MIELNLNKGQGEIMMVTVAVIVDVIVTTIVAGAMMAVVDLMVGSVLSVESLGTLLGSVLVMGLEVASMVVGVIVMVEVVAVTVLIGMEIDLVGAAGMQVVVGDLEVIDTIVIDLDPMTVVELGVLVLVKMTACADELGCCFLAKHEVSFLQNVLSSLLSGWNNIIVQSFEV